MKSPIYLIAINGAPDARDFNRMPFGRQLEHWPTIREFQASAKRTHLDCKGRKVREAIREFIIGMRCTEWFGVDRTAPNWKDDSIEFWYRAEA